MSYNQDFKAIEAKISDFWSKSDYKTIQPHGKNSSYVLGMFPYPSGNAHMGHVRVFTISDIHARLKRFQGQSVLHPLGWDSFGLPAENAAIQNASDPEEWTQSNIIKMKEEQLSAMGFSFDMAHEIATSDPNFYKWSQWLFLKLYEKGLVYRKNSWVNWDPVDQTVLANEQVIDGKGWRSGAQVERREMRQWHIAITQYAEELWNGIDNLDGWSDAAKGAQKNWIGRKEGLKIRFQSETGQEIPVFTTRPETIYGATALIIAPEHPLALELTIDANKEVAGSYLENTKYKSDIDRLSDKEKTGVFTGSFARHPLTQKQIPIIIADYVLPEQGTGAIMAVPAHSKPDYELSQTLDIPIEQVIHAEEVGQTELPYTDEAGIMANSEHLSGQTPREARETIKGLLLKQGLAETAVTYRLRDWAVGRQRYWGCPIPMAQDTSDAWKPVSLDSLPITLVPEDGGQAGKLSRSKESLNHYFPDGSKGILSADTMDTFMCSSWYIFRFTDPQNDAEPFSKEKAAQWLPVDIYVGGLEHANQHLIYLRFMSHFLHDLGYLPGKEPIKQFLDNGLVRVDGEKMSKSKGNSVRPDDMAEKYGADALRLFIMSDEPFQSDVEWNESGVLNKKKFLSRIDRYFKKAFQNFQPREITIEEIKHLSPSPLIQELNHFCEKVTDEIEANNFHNAIASLHAFSNTLNREIEQASDANEVQMHLVRFSLQQFLKPLGIFAPHLAEHLWQKTTGLDMSLFSKEWPDLDGFVTETATADVKIPFMVNGKPIKGRSISFTPANDSEKQEEQLRGCFNDFATGELPQTEGRSLQKVIVIRGKEGDVRSVNYVVA